MFAALLFSSQLALAHFTQEGPKLVGSGGISTASFGVLQGYSAALSGDGNTLAVGAPNDNSGIGAGWVFTQTGGVWTQQGSKLIGSGAVGNAGQGNSVALSADGNTIIIGGPSDNVTGAAGGGIGAAWVFTRSGGTWTQQAKLVGSNALGSPGQGRSVALSADGNTAIVGGLNDGLVPPSRAI